MPTNCSSCFGEIDCPADEMFPYSLTGTGPYGFVINCPEGSNCNNAQSVSMTCCGQTVTADISPSLSAAERVARVQRLVAQCHLLNSGCSDPAADGSDASTITNFYYSHRQNVSRECTRRSGTYHYSVLPGSAIASSQALADAQAAEIGEAFMDSHAFCLNVPVLFGCADAATTLNMSTVGGDGPFTVSVTSGSLPAGMTLTVVGGVIRMSGTPTTPGLYELEIQIDDAVGGYLLVDLEVTILEITTTSLPDFNVGVPYSQQLTGAGGSGDYAWSITAGALPEGLTMSDGGLISGTPTGDTNAEFTVRMTDVELGLTYGCTAALGIGFGQRVFYYTLDAFVSNYMVNAAADPADNNLDLPTSGAPELTIVAGKISNAVQRLTGALYTLPRTKTLDSDGFGFGEYLNLSDKSWTVRFWMKHLSNMGPTEHNMIFIADINREQGVSITSYANPAEFPMCRYKAYVSNATFAAPDIELESAQIDGTTDWQNWHRVVVAYDSQAEMLKIKINNDAYATQAAPGDYSMDSISRALWAIVPVQVAFTNYVIDELAVIVGSAWSDADCTYDWNGGAGRTYPDLP